MTPNRRRSDPARPDQPATPAEPLTVETWPIERVRPYANNPRRNEQAVEKVKASLREFGWRQPLVVDAHGIIVVGHTRYLAAQALAMAEVPVHVAANLTPEQVRAYRIADNRTNEEAEWDEAKLIRELQDLDAAGVPLSQTGFDDDELERMMADDDVELEPLSVQPLPVMTWVLIGIPTVKYGEINEAVERIAAMRDVTVEMTANSAALPEGV